MNITDMLTAAWRSLTIAGELLFYSFVMFGSLALLVKGSEAIEAAKRAATQIRLNLSLYVFDTLFTAPMVGLLVQAVRGGVRAGDLFLIPTHVWDATWPPLTLAAVFFIGDFGSYWRHRLEHTRWLWPTHAVHHSDDQMTWMTLSRFHPLNRVTTSAIDIGFLAILGFPDWALVGNELLRHYYGEFIHADLPWTYGPVGRLFVSPAMHRWHHARDYIGSGSNFATVFSVFDQAFGTFYVPGPCNVPLGVTDDMIPTAWSQLSYPFRAWAADLRGTPPPAPPTEAAGVGAAPGSTRTAE